MVELGTRAERVRQRREAFERALADNVPVGEARFRIARERWSARDVKLAASQCGTEAPALPSDEDEGRQLQWWQR